MADNRKRKTERRRGNRLSVDPAARRRWARKHKLSRYGLPQELFDLLLEMQGHSCGMCRKLFQPGQAIYVDHDHGHCKEEKRSCGDCVRGLLCLSCNTALGQIERKYAMARAYLASPPGRLLSGA